MSEDRDQKIAGRRLRNFARVRDVLGEDCLMIKRALSAVALAKTFGVAGFLILCLPLSAQQQETQRADIFSALNSSDLHLRLLTLSDAPRFSFSGAVVSPLSFSWMKHA